MVTFCGPLLNNPILSISSTIFPAFHIAASACGPSLLRPFDYLEAPKLVSQADQAEPAAVHVHDGDCEHSWTLHKQILLQCCLLVWSGQCDLSRTLWILSRDAFFSNSLFEQKTDHCIVTWDCHTECWYRDCDSSDQYPITLWGHGPDACHRLPLYIFRTLESHPIYNFKNILSNPQIHKSRRRKCHRAREEEYFNE